MRREASPAAIHTLVAWVVLWDLPAYLAR